MPTRYLTALTLLMSVLLGSATWSAPARAEIFVIDRNQTYVGFSWTHLGFTKQFGRFTDFDGTISFDPENPEAGAVDVSIRAGSVQTGVEALDRHLRTADFFDAANARTIKFKSTAVRKTGEKSGEVDGELTIRNETHPVTLEVTWLFTGDHPLQQINPAFAGRRLSAFSAKTKIQRSKWGLTRASNLVGDDIEIRLEVESTGQPKG